MHNFISEKPVCVIMTWVRQGGRIHPTHTMVAVASLVYLSSCLTTRVLLMVQLHSDFEIGGQGVSLVCC